MISDSSINIWLGRIAITHTWLRQIFRSDITQLINIFIDTTWFVDISNNSTYFWEIANRLPRISNNISLLVRDTSCLIYLFSSFFGLCLFIS